MSYISPRENVKLLLSNRLNPHGALVCAKSTNILLSQECTTHSALACTVEVLAVANTEKTKK